MRRTGFPLSLFTIPFAFAPLRKILFASIRGSLFVSIRGPFLCSVAAIREARSAAGFCVATVSSLSIVFADSGRSIRDAGYVC
jgi:hypothetical protein